MPINYDVDYPKVLKLCQQRGRDIERLEARVAELDGRIAKALPVAAELDCMLASHAKSKKAYSTMQDMAEYLGQALGERDE